MDSTGEERPNMHGFYWRGFGLTCMDSTGMEMIFLTCMDSTGEFRPDRHGFYCGG